MIAYKNPNRNKQSNRHRNYYEMNCMGYALGHKKWLFIQGGYKNATVEQLLDYGLVPIKKSEMVLGKRYIAYRFGSHDFHFMVRNEKGHWRHKMGYKKATSISEKEVFNKNGWSFDSLFYNSKVYLYECR